MFEYIQNVVEWLGLAPMHVVAVCIALMISWPLAQAVKKNFVMDRLWIRGFAFAFAFVPAYMLAPGWGMLEFWIAFAAGVLSPALYKLLVAFASHRWQWVRNLSEEKE